MPNYEDLPNGDCGDGICNPYPTHVVPNKYWAQRKRYFVKFDEGICLDPEGWFSVTPEIIAHHIARRMIRSSLVDPKKPNPLIVLDAFVGMGGNAIALAQYAEVDLVICTDIDLEKLYMAAHNCSVYDIPRTKILFLHLNACHVLQFYRDGCCTSTRSSADASIPSSSIKTDILQEDTNTDKTRGYKFGTLDDIPDHLDMIFLSPPWGGTNYETVGRRHYHLDQIQLVPPTKGDSMVTGVDLLRMAVTALPPDQLNIAFFLPRNLNGMMFGLNCHHCGIRGCVELEQNIVNSKLKTITAYIQSRICPNNGEQKVKSSG